MPSIQFWFSGTSIYLAGSFAFGILVGLLGIIKMVSRGTFLLLCVLGLFITGLAWRTAATQESDASEQKKQSEALQKSVSTLQQSASEQAIRLKQISDQNIEMKSAIGEIATAAKVPNSSPNLIEEIIKKIPRAITTNVKGKGNVFSINQSGGVTAGTVINQSTPPPTFQQDGEVITSQNDDGSFTSSVIIKIKANSPPNNIAIAIDGPTVLGLTLTPLDMPMHQSHSGTISTGGYVEVIDSPIGRIKIDAKTKNLAVPVNVGIFFNRDL